MRKSRAETAETRKRIVAVASNVFAKRGLTGAALEDVMAAAGLTLGGFYRHFDSKEQLIAEASAAAFQEFANMSEVAAAGRPPREALDILVRTYLNQLEVEEVNALCPLANLGSELRHADGEVKKVASEGYVRMVERFSSYIERAGIADPAPVAEAVVTTIVGAVSLAQLVTEPSAGKAILANAKDAVDTLIASGYRMSDGER